MNLYDFFNSPDVATHCQNINHTFTAVECAVMVNNSEKRTLKEKHEAYRAIIAEYPDMEIPEALNHEHIKSFHEALRGVIAFEEQLLEKFLSTEPETSYQAEGYLFSSYEKALAFMDIEDEKEWRIYKKYINHKGYICADVSKEGKILYINYAYFKQEDIFADFDFESSGLLDSFYVHIPVPFKAGDLVECNNTYLDGIFVLKEAIDYRATSEDIRNRDTTDMIASVYYECNGNIECEVMHFYPNLRYCRRELEGEKRLLKYVSLYEQKKLCLCGLLRVQKYIMLNEKAKELRNDGYLTYQLELIGDKLLLRE